MAVTVQPPFTLKVGDLARPVQYALIDGSGVKVDLTLATSVSFKMVQNGAANPKTVTGTATINSPASAGIVQYSWQAGDTSVAGSYHAEFTVLWTGGTAPDTFPSDTYIDIEILPKA